MFVTRAGLGYKLKMLAEENDDENTSR